MNRRQACSGLVRPGSIRPSQAPSGLIISGRNLRMHDGQDALAQGTGDPDAASVGSVAVSPLLMTWTLLVSQLLAHSHSRRYGPAAEIVRRAGCRVDGAAAVPRSLGLWPTGFGALQSPSARSPARAASARPRSTRRQRHSCTPRLVLAPGPPNRRAVEASNRRA